MPAIPMSNYLLQVVVHCSRVVRVLEGVLLAGRSCVGRSTHRHRVQRRNRRSRGRDASRTDHPHRRQRSGTRPPLEPLARYPFAFQEVHFPIQTKFRSMHISSVEGVHDMILLGDLKESAILHNLHMRYKEDAIYVRRCAPSPRTRSNSVASVLDLHGLDSSRGQSVQAAEHLQH